MGQRPGIALALCALASSCAGPHMSHREPYAGVDEGPYVPPEPASEQARFEIAEAWSWARALEEVPGGRPAAVQGALEVPLGLFPGSDFSLKTGRCEGCRAPEAALWYFQDEVIAVPRQGVPTAGLDPVEPTGAFRLRPLPRPLLVWAGSPELIDDAALSADARSLVVGDERIPLVLTPQDPINRHFANASTALFFQRGRVRARGAWAEVQGRRAFVARTLWPKEAAIDPDALVLEPLQRHEPLSTVLQAQEGGVHGIFSTRLLWERTPGAPRRWAGLPVIAMVLNGSQADDDGGQGGHIAVATGIFPEDGDWSDWLVNNFYPLDNVTEERVLSAAVPMDRYLFDLNSGQAYLHPSTMWVAVLRRPDAANLFQWALQETHVRYYCHDIEFHRSAMNSTRLAIEPMRSVGWRIPFTGPTSWWLGLLSLPISAGVALLTDFGPEPLSGLMQEKTYLLPREAYQVAGHDLLHLLTTRDEAVLEELTPLERRLVEDVEAVFFVRIPQAPTGRSTGTYPVGSLFEYGVRVLDDPTPWEQPPLPDAPPFPEALKQTCRARTPAR